MATVAADLDRRLARAQPRKPARLRAVPPAEPQAPRPARRWALLALLVLALGFALDFGWRWLVSADLFPLEAVRLVTAVQHVGEDELRAAIEPHVDRGMLALDVAAIRRALEELPWVATAAVRRQWPGTLEISLEEQVAMARWNGDAVLNLQGEVFRPAPATVREGLAELVGPPGSEREVAARYERLDALLAPVGLPVTGVVLDERRAWRVILDGGIEMRMGAGDGEAEVRRFARAYPRLAERAHGSLKSVDLRYPNGFALAWGKAGDGKGTN